MATYVALSFTAGCVMYRTIASQPVKKTHTLSDLQTLSFSGCDIMSRCKRFSKSFLKSIQLSASEAVCRSTIPNEMTRERL